MNKLILEFNIHGNKWVTHHKLKGAHIWLVVMEVQNQEEKIEVEMNNLQPVLMISLLPLIMEQLTECIGELSPITEAKFSVYLKEK